MKNICVFLSASQVPKKYLGPAKKLGRLLAEYDLTMVWGGSDRGLMKVVADEVKKHGGKLISISMPLVKKYLRKGDDEVIMAKDLPDRKKIMAARSDAFVVLVGGIGTLDEVTELMELKKHGIHNKPIIFLNTANFYSGLKVQLDKMEAEGFLPKKLSDLILFVQTPAEVFKYLLKFK
jgi:hypothetical protein